MRCDSIVLERITLQEAQIIFSISSVSSQYIFKMSYIEKLALQDELLRQLSSIENNKDGQNNAIILEIRKQLSRQNKVNIGAVAIKKKMRERKTRVHQNCPKCTCAKRKLGRRIESEPGALANEIEKRAQYYYHDRPGPSGVLNDRRPAQSNAVDDGMDKDNGGQSDDEPKSNTLVSADLFLLPFITSQNIKKKLRLFVKWHVQISMFLFEQVSSKVDESGPPRSDTDDDGMDEDNGGQSDDEPNSNSLVSADLFLLPSIPSQNIKKKITIIC
jgi:hypothetical protein